MPTHDSYSAGGVGPCSALATLSVLLACRLGHTTGHFNVGYYRRNQKTEEEVQDAAFFDHSNEVSFSLNSGKGSDAFESVVKMRRGLCLILASCYC